MFTIIASNFVREQTKIYLTQSREFMGAIKKLAVECYNGNIDGRSNMQVPRLNRRKNKVIALGKQLRTETREK